MPCEEHYNPADFICKYKELNYIYVCESIVMQKQKKGKCPLFCRSFVLLLLLLLLLLLALLILLSLLILLAIIFIYFLSLHVLFNIIHM